MTTLVSIENLSFAYRGDDGGTVPVFRDITLRLAGGGTILGVVGRNGSGKSTLFDLIRGRITPDSGSIRIQGAPQSGYPRMVSLVTQRPDASLCPTMTVLENFALVRTAGKWSMRLAFGRGQREECRKLVARAGMGLERDVDEQVRFLSGGQKQALAVLFALSMERAVLLMDEPTAALDHVSAAAVLRLAAEYGRTRNGAVAIISHKIDELLPICDGLVVVGDGVIQHFSKEDVEWTVSGIQALL